MAVISDLVDAGEGCWWWWWRIGGIRGRFGFLFLFFWVYEKKNKGKMLEFPGLLSFSNFQKR